MEARSAIFEDFRRTREKHAKELERRRQYVYEKLPELRQMQEEIENAAVSQLNAVLSDPFHADEAIENAQKRIEELKCRQKDLLGKNPELANMLEMEYDCALCRDTGIVEGKRCVCLVKKLLQGGQLDLPLLQQQNFDTFDITRFPEDADGVPQREKMQKVYDAARRYTRNFPHNEQPNFFVCGGTGLGKTFLLSCIAKEILEKGYYVQSYTSYRFFQRMLNYHLGKEDSIEDILNTDLLIIDDLGTEPEYKNVNTNYLFMVLNERICRKKHTVCASNLKITELKERYGERISSRLFDKSITYAGLLAGKDLRLLKRT